MKILFDAQAEEKAKVFFVFDDDTALPLVPAAHGLLGDETELNLMLGMMKPMVVSLDHQWTDAPTIRERIEQGNYVEVTREELQEQFA